VFVAAQRVIAVPVARPDTGLCEAAEGRAADEEGVIDLDALAEALDIADLAGRRDVGALPQRVVIPGADSAADVEGVATEARNVVAQANVVPALRVDPAVAPVVEQLLANHRGITDALFVLDGFGGVMADVSDVCPGEGVVPSLPQILLDVVAGAQAGADVVLAEGAFRLQIGRDAEKVEAGGNRLVQEVGLGIGQIDLRLDAGQREIEPQVVAGAEQIVLADANAAERSLAGRIAE